MYHGYERKEGGERERVDGERERRNCQQNARKRARYFYLRYPVGIVLRNPGIPVQTDDVRRMPTHQDFESSPQARYNTYTRFTN